MSLFHGTVDFYHRYRPGIPHDVADVLDAAVDSSGPRRLLDVGTGTGQVVEALLGRFDDVIAIDNDPDMVASTGDALRPALPPGSTASTLTDDTLIRLRGAARRPRSTAGSRRCRRPTATPPPTT